MDFLTDWLTNWLKELLISGIMGNLEGLFDTVNAKVGEIAVQVGTTPAAWNAGVFSLIRQLSDIQARHRNTCELDSVMESLQSHLLTRKEEEDFRNAFLSVYPSALLHLREACPAVTRSEELFCMLVLLKQSNEELARTLGISVASVSKTRYRIRVKLGLPEGSDTDAEIRHIMAGEDL